MTGQRQQRPLEPIVIDIAAAVQLQLPRLLGDDIRQVLLRAPLHLLRELVDVRIRST